MLISSQMIIFIIGFIVGSCVIAFLYYFFNSLTKPEETKNEDLTSIKDDMDSIKLAFQNFNLAQNVLRILLFAVVLNNKEHGENLY